MIDYSKALEWKKYGTPIDVIRSRLFPHMKYKAFQRGLLRYEANLALTNGPFPTEEEYQERVVKLTEKLASKPLPDLLTRLKDGVDIVPSDSSERVLRAEIEDLRDKGYNIIEIDGKYRLMNHLKPSENRVNEDWDGAEKITFAVIADTHIGSIYTQMTFLNDLYDLFQRRGIQNVYHAGDLAEGQYTNRPGHIYECHAHGADQQADYIIRKYPKREGVTTKFIIGNHEQTFMRNAGVDIGRIITRERPDMVYLGADNAIINLTPNCTLELNHPGDGSAYSISYSIQKYMESMAGGEKPNILFNGHHHKAMYMFYRNIHAFEAGTIQGQSGFMKSKRLAAHMGGWIITVTVDKDGSILSCASEFIPLYKAKKHDY